MFWRGVVVVAVRDLVVVVHVQRTSRRKYRDEMGAKKAFHLHLQFDDFLLLYGLKNHPPEEEPEDDACSWTADVSFDGTPDGHALSAFLFASAFTNSTLTSFGPSLIAGNSLGESGKL